MNSRSSRTTRRRSKKHPGWRRRLKQQLARLSARGPILLLHPLQRVMRHFVLGIEGPCSFILLDCQVGLLSMFRAFRDARRRGNVREVQSCRGRLQCTLPQLYTKPNRTGPRWAAGSRLHSSTAPQQLVPSARQQTTEQPTEEERSGNNFSPSTPLSFGAVCSL